VAKKAIEVVVNEKLLFKEQLSDDLADSIKLCQEKIDEIDWLRRKLIKKAYPEFDWLYQDVSTYWRCEASPCGYCTYDSVNDRAHDTCIFCGEPEERK